MRWNHGAANERREAMKLGECWTRCKDRNGLIVYNNIMKCIQCVQLSLLPRLVVAHPPFFSLPQATLGDMRTFQFSQSPTCSLCALLSRPLDFTSSPCFGFVNNTVIGLITSLGISASQIAFPLVRVRHQTSNHLAQLSPDSMCHLDSPLPPD